MDWTVIGINYQKANLEQRQKYALNEEQVLEIYEMFKHAKIPNALILCTCNRTECFIPSELKQLAIEVLTTKFLKTKVDQSLFHCKEDEEAVVYFFRICSGLESQIAGDFEILGQVRKAFRIAKENKMLSGTWERTINSALASAKKARTTTGFYSGATSTSYASIEHLKRSNIDLKASKYLIIGAGTIGAHTIDHLLKFAPCENITLSNRSLNKAQSLADEKSLAVLPFQQLSLDVSKYDVIICSTSAPKFILTPSMFGREKKHHIIDLSVPMNVDPALKSFKNISLINVDELSKEININLQKRDAERINVEKIILEGIEDLNAWFTIKSSIPMLTEIKSEMEELKKEALSNISSDNIEHSEAFLDEYTDDLFNHMSQQWIKKVRNKTLDDN